MLHLQESAAELNVPRTGRAWDEPLLPSIAQRKQLSRERGLTHSWPFPARGCVSSSGSNSLGPERSDSLETSQQKGKRISSRPSLMSSNSTGTNVD